MEQPLGRRLALTHRVVHDALDRRLREHDASLWNWVLLREAATADGASQRELAALMGIEPPTLVRHLDKLAADGFVERRPDPTDRRVARVVVTPAGRTRHNELHRVARGFDRELRSLLTPNELEVLGTALARLHEHFSEEVAGGRS